MHEIADQLEKVKARWMTGDSAEAACPASWKDALGDTPDVSLLALVGQFSHIAMRPVGADAIEDRALLPVLALPALPDRLRPEFQRLIATKAVKDVDVVRLIAARGYVVSPVDWMPNANDNGLPDVYTPWLDWLAQRPDRAEDVPTADTWDQWSPQARLAHVERLRKTEPDAGRVLIEAVAPTLAAEPRLRLASYLQIGLSDADVPYLTTLQSDRSGKVQSLATSLLAQLGQIKADAEATAEMADFFETVKAGILSRKTALTARKLKTNAQRQRRAKLAELVPLSALAEQLGLGTANLVATWDFEDGTNEIATMVASTGSDADVQAFLERMVEKLGADGNVTPLIDRLPVEKRPLLAGQIIARDGPTFSSTASLLAHAPGTLTAETICASGAFKEFEQALKDDKDTNVHVVNVGFAKLGLIADAAAAQALIKHFTEGGLTIADPRLALLRLNAALQGDSK